MGTQPKQPKALPPGAHSIKARRQRVAAAGKGTSDVGKVHETVEAIASVELSPPHPPRETTPEYAKAHHFLVYEKKAPCEACNVTIDTLADPSVNTYGAKALETHHYPIERSLADACDPVKVHADFPSVYDLPTLMAFVDSPGNLKVLCDIHHRSLEHGIHHLTPADFAVQRYLRAGYIVATSAKNAAAAVATDEQIEQAAGIEQAVDQQIAASVSAAADLSPASSASKPKRVARPRTSAPKGKVALA